MNARRSLALVLSLALVAAALPAMAAPVGSATPLRSSMDRAVLAAPPGASTASGSARAMQAPGVTGGGGGGGHMAMILVGLAVSGASTYFVMKQLKKTTIPTEPAPTGVRFGVTIRAGR
jgi:hypothetical protein